MTVTFEKRKEDFLNKRDKSSIGKWDKKIIDLCEKINKKKEYFTLSSCSGRIVLLKNAEEKRAGLFVFRSHDAISFKQLKKELQNYQGKEGLVFKQEPCILHIACNNLINAKKLLRKAQESGWKNSGIIAIAENRIVIDLRSTEGIYFPIHSGKKILLEDSFLELIVREANDKLKRTWHKIQRLHKII